MPNATWKKHTPGTADAECCHCPTELCEDLYVADFSDDFLGTLDEWTSQTTLVPPFWNPAPTGWTTASGLMQGRVNGFSGGGVLYKQMRWQGVDYSKTVQSADLEADWRTGDPMSLNEHSLTTQVGWYSYALQQVYVGFLISTVWDFIDGFEYSTIYSYSSVPASQGGGLTQVVAATPHPLNKVFRVYAEPLLNSPYFGSRFRVYYYIDGNLVDTKVTSGPWRFGQMGCSVWAGFTYYWTQTSTTYMPPLQKIMLESDYFTATTVFV